VNGTEATRWPVQVGTGFLMSRLGPEIRRLRCELLAEVGLSASHYAVLTAIRQFGPMSQKRLSIIVGTDPRNVVTTLDELDDRSLVQRTRDSADRRRQVVSLTKRGQATIASLDHDADAVDDVFFRQLNSAQRAALHAALLTLFTGLVRETTQTDKPIVTTTRRLASQPGRLAKVIGKA